MPAGPPPGTVTVVVSVSISHLEVNQEIDLPHLFDEFKVA
jgi:hypothetical protein